MRLVVYPQPHAFSGIFPKILLPTCLHKSGFGKQDSQFYVIRQEMQQKLDLRLREAVLLVTFEENLLLVNLTFCESDFPQKRL